MRGRVASAVELGHELAVGRTGGGEVVVTVVELELQVDHLLFEGGDPGLELLGVVGAADAGLAPDLLETSVEKWSQPTQRNRRGQAPPPAATLDGSEQMPKGTTTEPTAWRVRSASSKVVTAPQTRVPWRSNCMWVTLSTASRRRTSFTRW